jgi:hypothetical protein
MKDRETTPGSDPLVLKVVILELHKSFKPFSFYLLSKGLLFEVIVLEKAS